METKRRLLILTALALLLPTFASPSITSAAEHTFPPPGEVIDAQILEATQDQKTNALMTAIHAVAIGKAPDEGLHDLQIGLKRAGDG